MNMRAKLCCINSVFHVLVVVIAGFAAGHALGVDTPEQVFEGSGSSAAVLDFPQRNRVSSLRRREALANIPVQRNAGTINNSNALFRPARQGLP